MTMTDDKKNRHPGRDAHAAGGPLQPVSSTEAMLEDLFQSARAEWDLPGGNSTGDDLSGSGAQPSVAPDLMARILADARDETLARGQVQDRYQDDTGADTRDATRADMGVDKGKTSSSAIRRWLRGLGADLGLGFGGWPAAAGLTAATVAGVWLGVSQPQLLDPVATRYGMEQASLSQTVALSDAGDPVAGSGAATGLAAGAGSESDAASDAQSDTWAVPDLFDDQTLSGFETLLMNG